MAQRRSAASLEHWDAVSVSSTSVMVYDPAQVAVVAGIPSLAQELHMPWGGQERKKKYKHGFQPSLPLVMAGPA